MTRPPEELYTLHEQETDLGAPVLVHALTGFLDAGSAGRLAAEHLLAALDSRPLATFDVDDLMDYRARRPKLSFVADRYTAVEMPALVLHELTDLDGTRFLLLHGPEPDVAWVAVTRAVIGLVERFGVRLCVGIHAIPWPAPHTRPVGVTAHATDPALVEGRTPWVGALEVPGHLAGLLELRLGEAGHRAVGFAAHVPHYLAGASYPRAAVTLLEEVAGAGGLSLPLDALRAGADEVDSDVSGQVASSAENQEAVAALEEQYDQVRAARSAGLDPEADLPDADELAAQVEQFLAEMNPDRPEDQP